MADPTPQYQDIKTPDYDKPPVVETVLGLQFAELTKFRTAHFGDFWQEIREKYPIVYDQPRLPPIAETFPRLPEQSGVMFRAGPMPERVWYGAESMAELIQLQPDRLLFNWRQQLGQPYPKYDSYGPAFLKLFDRFSSYCVKREFGEPKVNACEMTYVNHLIPEPRETAIKLFGKVFAGLKWAGDDDWQLPLESAQFNRAYIIGENRGRVYAEASIGTKTDGGKAQDFVLLRLTARLNYSANGNQGIKQLLDEAHCWAARGFAAITDLGIQRKRWELVE